MLDMQAWYVKNKMSNMQFPADRIVDRSYIDYALKKLGPFVLENKDEQARRLPLIRCRTLPDETLAAQNACRQSVAIVAVAAAITWVAAAQAQQHTVRVAVVRALTSTPPMIANQKGYFKEHGIKVEVSDIDTTALVPLAQNQVQVMEAGMTAGYFNALEKDFPITIASDRAATPILPQAADPARPEGPGSRRSPISRAGPSR